MTAPVIIIKTNVSKLTAVLIKDMGIVIPASGGSETLSLDESVESAMQSEDLRAYCTDDAYGAGSSTLILNDGSSDIAQADIEDFLDSRRLDGGKILNDVEIANLKGTGEAARRVSVTDGSNGTALEHLPLKNFSGTVDPDADNDSTEGYSVGSRWINTTDDKEFVCLDATATAAVWTETTGAGGAGQNLYDAVVAASGGDYTSVAAAFGAGKKSVFVKTGTYVETADVVVPDGGHLIGEEAGVVIDFNSGAYSVTVDGNGGTTETTGTISITSGTTQVTGSGTTFTNLSPGDYILLHDIFYEIDTITSATVLDLVDTYQGKSISGESFIGQSMFKHVVIQNIEIENSSQTGLVLRGVRESSIYRVECAGNATNASISQCGDIGVVTSTCWKSTTGPGLQVIDSSLIALSSSHCFNNATRGLEISGTSASVTVDQCHCNQNGSEGINVLAGDRIVLSSCITTFNDGKGINTEPGTTSVTIDACEVHDNGDYGVDYDGDENKVVGCTIADNTLAGIRAGVEGIIEANHIFGNGTDGIELNGDNECTIVGNHIHDNTSDGIAFIGAANDDVLISANHIYDNGAWGIVIPAGNTGVCIGPNRIYGNTSGQISNSESTVRFDISLPGNPAQGDIAFKGSSTAQNEWARLAPGTNGQVLQTQGAAANPQWADAVMDGDFTAAEGWLHKISAGSYEAIKTNLNASADPLATDDSGSGYAVGSRWINTTLDKEFVCLDSTVSSAVWTETTGAGGGGGQTDTVTGQNGVTNTGDDVDAVLELANMVQATIKGRASGAGTGTPQDLTPTQARTILNVEDNADVTDATNVAAAGAVMDSDISESEGFMRKTGAGAYEAIKTNLAAAVDPDVNDDSGSGYAIASRWINTTDDKEWVCLDASVGAAVWAQTNAGVGQDYVVFPVWAEENGTLSNSNTQWSFGNGSVGAIGVPLAVGCELFAVSFNVETAGTSVTIDVDKNGTQAYLASFGSGNDQLVNLATPVEFAAGDRVGFETNTVVGTFTDARVCAWFRVAVDAPTATQYFDAYDNTGGLALTTSFAPLGLDVERKKDAALYTHSTATLPAEVTVLETDTYLVMGQVSTQMTTGSTRSDSEARLELDTGSGFTYVDGTLAQMYNRTVSRGEETCSFAAILDLDANDKLRITVRMVAGANVSTFADGSRLQIIRIGRGLGGPPGSGGAGGGQTDTVTGSSGITNVGDNVDADLAPTYGTGANTICQGNDSRLSDARTPTSHAPSHQNGGGDEVGTATPAANAIPKADGSGRLNGWVGNASTAGTGLIEIATVAEADAASDTSRAVTPQGAKNNAVKLRYTGTSINLLQSTSPTVMAWDVQDFIDTDYFTHSTTVNNGRLTVDKTGTYRVSYGLAGQQNDTTFKGMQTHCMINGTTPIVGSSASSMAQNNVLNRHNPTTTFLVELTAGDYVTVRFLSVAGTGTCNNTDDECHFEMMFLRR